MRIARQSYIDRLEERRENGSIKIITGIRRCGKTYLLFDLYVNRLMDTGVPDGRIIRIALDEDENAALRDPGRLGRYIESRLGGVADMHYVMIDEVQYAITREELAERDNPPRIYGVLNGLLRRGNVDVYVTGSNSKLLSSDVRTEFRGRGDEIRVRPLSFSEYLPAHGGTAEDAWLDYVAFGGLPHVLSFASDQGRADYLTSLMEKVYIDDIVERNGLRGSTAIGNVVDVLASSVGSLTNPTKLANTFSSHGMGSIDDKTVRSYIDFLKDAFLVEEVPRYDVRGRKHIGAQKKYYYEDLGLRNARLNFRQQEETHLMENALYNELVFRGYSVDVGVVEHVEKDEDGKRRRKQLEIDFVCNMASKRYYIQSAFAIPDAEKMEQEQRSLTHTGDSFKKIIVVRNRVKPWHNDQGVLIVGLTDFLTNPSLIDE
jgi:predicted AAA+ superfamily ATPase